MEDRIERLSILFGLKYFENKNLLRLNSDDSLGKCFVKQAGG